MSHSIQAISFERQQTRRGQRMCGAAALCMVYRSLGLACKQGEVWDHITRGDHRGERSARTYLLAADALARGLSAVVLRARAPWTLLERCLENDLRVILNPRLAVDSPAGHFMVLVGLTLEHVLVHDPQAGPAQRWTRDEFLRCWQPLHARTEIAGQVLVAFGMEQAGDHRCVECGGTLPATLSCPGCRRAIPVRPAAAVGCLHADCASRAWESLYCPLCDYAVSEA